MKIFSIHWSALLSVALTTNVYAQTDSDAPATTSDQAEATAEETKTEEELLEDKKRANARELATNASNDYRMGRFQEAYDGFNRAFRLIGVPALGVWSARSLRQANHLVEASERYREVLKTGASPQDPESYHQSLRDAQAELDELLTRIPSLTIRLQNARAEDVEVKMDGELVDPALVGVKQRVNPGNRTIVATRGKEVVRETITLQERATGEVTLTFKAGYQAPSKKEDEATTIQVQQGFTPMQTVGIVVMSGGAALLITGVVTTALALGQQSDLRKNCPSRQCASEFHDDVDKFNTMKWISTGALIGGAALGALGAVIYTTSGPRSKEADPSVALGVRGTTLELSGTF